MSKPQIKIYKMQLAGELMIRGFRLLRTYSNPTDNSRLIFIFHDSKLIRDAIEEITYNATFYKKNKCTLKEL